MNKIKITAKKMHIWRIFVDKNAFIHREREKKRTV